MQLFEDVSGSFAPLIMVVNFYGKETNFGTLRWLFLLFFKKHFLTIYGATIMKRLSWFKVGVSFIVLQWSLSESKLNNQLLWFLVCGRFITIAHFCPCTVVPIQYAPRYRDEDIIVAYREIRACEGFAACIHCCVLCSSSEISQNVFPVRGVEGSGESNGWTHAANWLSVINKRQNHCHNAPETRSCEVLSCWRSFRACGSPRLMSGLRQPLQRTRFVEDIFFFIVWQSHCRFFLWACFWFYFSFRPVSDP